MCSEAAVAYSLEGHDAVRARFESGWFAARLPALLTAAPGGEVLDLGCGDGGARRLCGSGLSRYVGVDLVPPAAGSDWRWVQHDLRDGLGPVGRRPFDLYLGTFGIASHLAPAELGRLLDEIAAHAKPGSIVALEALGLLSLEWPQLWNRRPGADRTIPYRMAADVSVHPWAPSELFELFAERGIRPLCAGDRTVQAGPKLGEGRYWRGLPDVRGALNAGLERRTDAASLSALRAPLPPLPAGRAALVHHALAGRRARLPAQLPCPASTVWKLEPRSAAGYGHGLFVVGRVGG
jgi:SAM-dependent methyltransferase